MQVAASAVGAIEIIRNHADPLAFIDAAPVQKTSRVHNRRVHMHIAKAEMFGTAIDLQRGGLLLRRSDNYAVAHRAYRLLVAIASFRETLSALSDTETARFAKIILPWIAGVSAGPLVERLVGRPAIPERLRMGESGSFFQRKPNLRINRSVRVANLFSESAVDDDIPTRAIGEISRAFHGPLGNRRWNIHSRPRGHAAGDAQRSEETFGYRVGFAAGQPLRVRRAVEALDRHHIRDTEAGEGVAHIAFPDEAAEVGVPCRQGLDRFALAAKRIIDVIDQDRAGDLNFDRLGKDSLRNAVAGAGLQRKHRVVTGRARVEQVDRPNVGLIVRQSEAGRRAMQAGLQNSRRVERQQHWDGAAGDPTEYLRSYRVQLHECRP